MPRKLSVFISHKREDGKAITVATNLHGWLTNAGFYVFIDVKELRDADLWRDRIIKEVQQADVLLVLLQAETAKSDWIQREVDMARGLGVRIVPIQIDSNVDVEDAKKRLELGDIQWVKDFVGSTEDYQRLIGTILSTVKGNDGTWERQRRWIDQRQEHWRLIKANDELSVFSLKLTKYPNGCELHLSSGDITCLRTEDGSRVFDVIVNTENDHMQMARIFEKHRLSSALRREGALVLRGRLQEDTIQAQLDLQIDTHWKRPIITGQVIPTHAGHPDSNLVRSTGARYIFHAATAHVSDAYKPGVVHSLTDEAITDSVYNCINLVDEINAAKGIIFREGSEPYQIDKAAADMGYQPIESIIFPLFGTGHGELSVDAVAPRMLEAFRDFPRLHPQIARRLTLKRIYLCVFADEHIDVVKSKIQDMFR